MRRVGVRGAAPVVAGAALASLLGACGASHERTLDSGAVERAIAQSILTQRHAYATVSCPDGVPQRNGGAFSCVAHLDVGQYRLQVHETDDEGHVQWSSSAPLVVLDIKRVERAIRTELRRQRRLTATAVRCPRQVLQQAGLTFTCTVTLRGTDHPFEVTETDDAGHVTFVGK